MLGARSIGEFAALSGSAMAIVLALIAVNMTFNVVANAGFRESAVSTSVRGFLTWQIIGNLAGFATAVTLTILLRYIPLHVAFPITTGLAVIGVQVVASYMLFHESISNAAWVGAGLIVIGIVLIGHH